MTIRRSRIWRRPAAAIALFAALAMTLAFASATAQADPSGQAVKRYITVDDGTEIAVCIWQPPGFDPSDDHKWPTLFEMDGYSGCPTMNDNHFFGNTDKYVVVYAQVRGTGCSGGRLDLFSHRSSLDGRFIINRWIHNQPWSNDRVGITGHSYSGITGFLVAATHPDVQGVAVSGLIDDFYRSILYPGGIFNPGFPILWGALLRPVSEFSGNIQNYSSDPKCVLNQLEHAGSDTVPVQLVAPVYSQMTATKDSWAIRHSLATFERGLNAPIQINQQYQDEQTGPRGGYLLWQHVPAGLPKRLILSNGRHNPNDPRYDKGDWLDCWVIDDGQDCPAITGEVAGGGEVTVPVNDPATRVVAYFHSRDGASGQERNTPYLASDWPYPETNWQRYYLRADHSLDTSAAGGNGKVSYLSTTTDEHTTANLGGILSDDQPNVGPVTFIHGPNEARFTLPFSETTAISGPILLNLWLKSTAPDTDLFVDLLDRNTDTGELEYLQRGLMRASFRATDPVRSDRIASGPLAGTIYRPYHRYLTTKVMIPGQPYKVPVEIFPVGHVFYPGHELVMDIHAPPLNDPISTYSYEPHSLPAINTILQSSGHRSNLLLPLMSTLPPLWPSQPACQDISAYMCFTPVAELPSP